MKFIFFKEFSKKWIRGIHFISCQYKNKINLLCKNKAGSQHKILVIFHRIKAAIKPMTGRLARAQAPYGDLHVRKQIGPEPVSIDAIGDINPATRMVPQLLDCPTLELTNYLLAASLRPCAHCFRTKLDKPGGNGTYPYWRDVIFQQDRKLPDRPGRQQTQQVSTTNPSLNQIWRFSRRSNPANLNNPPISGYPYCISREKTGNPRT